MGITTPGVVDYHLSSQNASRKLAINALTPVTLMCWINATWNGGTRISMVGAYNSATAGGTAIQIGTGTGAGEVTVWTWGGTPLVNSTGITLSNGVWHHIAYTFDGTTHTLYVDGVANNTATTAQLAGTITAVFINGYPTGVAAETGTFSIEDISYFTRTLTAAEILTAFTTQGDKDGIYFSNVASFLFDEGTSGAVVSDCIDYTGNLNDLTPIGAATGVNFTYNTSPISADCRPPL